MKPDPTRNTRAARYRAATKTAGGVRVDVHIGPEAAAVLNGMRASGMTVREAVEAALARYASKGRWVPMQPRNAIPTLTSEQAFGPANPPAPAAPPVSTSAPAD